MIAIKKNELLQILSSMESEAYNIMLKDLVSKLEVTL